MKKLSWILFVLFLLVHNSQIAFAISPIASTSYIRTVITDSNLLDESLFLAMSKKIISQSTYKPNNQLLTGSNIINLNRSCLTIDSATLLDSNIIPNNQANNKTGGNTSLITECNYINLENGNILVNPEKDIVINTKESIISVAASSAVFIIKSGLGTVIYDLYQAKPKQIWVLVNKHKLVLDPGCMLVLTKQKTEKFEELAINCQSIKYGQARTIDLQENNVNGYIANFSTLSAIVQIQPLKNLVNSKNKHDQQLCIKC